MSMVRTDALSHDYLIYEDEESDQGTPVRALSEVTIDIREGEFVSILGHNGSGKSTLAKHLNALLLPTEGTVWIEGMDTKDDDKLWDIRQRAGMIFQNPDNQIIASVVEEDVAFGPENMGVPTQEIWDRVNSALERTGMTAYREHSPNRLSGGQKQRVAIAGVLAMQPKCIIMDEPTAMLDPVGRKEVLAAVHQLNRELGITVILITHYMEEVIDSDRLFVMNKGRVVMSGTPKELFARVEEFEELGLAVPQITMLGYELKKAGLDLPDAILTREEMTEALCRLR